MAATGVGSIGFMNISLHLNSVGFYQITKLAIVPATLCAQALLFDVSTSTKIKLSLSILLLGLGLATVTDVQLNAPDLSAATRAGSHVGGGEATLEGHFVCDVHSPGRTTASA